MASDAGQAVKDTAASGYEKVSRRVRYRGLEDNAQSSQVAQTGRNAYDSVANKFGDTKETAEDKVNQDTSAL